MAQPAITPATSTSQRGRVRRLVRIPREDTTRPERRKIPSRRRLPGGYGVANTFEYDANGLRVKKTDSAGTSSFLLDGLSIIGQYAPDGSRQAWYTQSLARIDEVLSVVNGQGKYWYQGDALGSVYALTTSTGAVQARGGYDVFGAAVAVSGTAVGQPFGFTGREHELDSGLVYARQRYLDPPAGRWTGPDRLGMPDGPNRYLQVLARPTAFTDPMGLEVKLYSERIGWRKDVWWVARPIVAIARHSFIRTTCTDCGPAYDLTVEIGADPGKIPPLNIKPFSTDDRIDVTEHFILPFADAPTSAKCAREQCILEKAKTTPLPIYEPRTNNSNTFAMRILGECRLAGLFPWVAFGANNDPFLDALFSYL